MSIRSTHGALRAESSPDIDEASLSSLNNKRRRLLSDNGRVMVGFLDFHLHVLKSLYDKKNEDTDNTFCFWEASIQRFLEQREDLLKAKHEAMDVRDIWSESRRLLLGGKGKNPPDESNKKRIMVDSNHMDTTPNIRNRHHRRRSNTTSSPAHAGYHHHNHHHVAAGAASNASQDDSFQIITRLLGRRSYIGKERFARLAAPFLSLLTETQNRLHSLHLELRTLEDILQQEDQKIMQDLLDFNKSPTTMQNYNDNDKKRKIIMKQRSNMEDVKSKIRLWSLLAVDLRQAILDDDDNKRDIVSPTEKKP